MEESEDLQLLGARGLKTLTSKNARDAYPPKNLVVTYFRFSEASCGLSPSLGHAAIRDKINDGRIANTRNSDSRLHREIQVESEPAPKKRRLRNKS